MGYPSPSLQTRPVPAQFCGFSGWDCGRESLLKAGSFPQPALLTPGSLEAKCCARRLPSPWALGWVSRAKLRERGPRLLRWLPDRRAAPVHSERGLPFHVGAPATASYWNFPHLPIPCLHLQHHPYLHTVQRVWRKPGPAQSLSEYFASTHQ